MLRAKFHEPTPQAPKFLRLIRYILSQFLTPLKKIVRGPPSAVRGGLVRLGHSVACVKIWVHSTPRGQNMVFRKSILGGYNFTSRSPRLLDQSSPDLLHLTQEESQSISTCLILNIFAAELRSHPKSGQILHVFSP